MSAANTANDDESFSIPWPRVLASLAVVSTLVLAHFLSTPSGRLTEFMVPCEATQPEGEELAQRVRYSDAFGIDGGAIRVQTTGPDASVEIALVSDEHPVRIRHVHVPGDAVFTDVAAGEWSIRAYARGSAGAIQVRAARTGSSVFLLGCVGVVMLAPLLLWRRT